MATKAYINGQIGNWDEMMISLSDRSVFFGDAVYDAVLVLGGKVVPYGDLLIEAADSFHVRGWAQDVDFDAVFVRDEQGNVTIQTCDA